MSEDFQSELNQIKSRLATIESVNRDAISSLLDRQCRVVAAAKSLTQLDSQCAEIGSLLADVKSQCADVRSSLAEAKS